MRLNTGLLLLILAVLPEADAALTGKFVVEDTIAVWVMDADGSKKTPLFSSLGTCDRAMWSPNGDRIAFSMNHPDSGVWAIYMMDADGSNLTKLTDDAKSYVQPDWSPNGQQLVIQGESGLFLLNPRGGKPVELTAGREEYPSFSPVENVIVFRKDGHIWLMDLDIGRMKQLTSHQGGFVQFPVWSPDGQLISYTFYRAWDKAEIYVVSKDGKQNRQVTNMPGFAKYSSAWSPDGEHIAFVTFDVGPNWRGGVYVANSDGKGEPRLLADGFAHSLDWTERSLSVSSSGRMPVRWGELKSERFRP